MQIRDYYKVSPIFMFFLLHSTQFGIGALGFSRILSKYAENDAWLSIILVGLLTHGIIFGIYYMLKVAGGNLIRIHIYVYGKVIGNLFNIGFVIYYFLVSISIIRGYIEIIQIWMFPTLSTLMGTVVLCVLIYYIMSSGFRVITGLCVISIFSSITYIFITLFVTMKYGYWGNLLPLFNHSIWDIVKTSQNFSYTFAGFEIILMIYPFIKTPQNSYKFAQYSIVFTNILYLITFISAVTCFSTGQLHRTIWSQLSIISVLQFSFIERLEYLVICAYTILIILNIIMPLWAASKGAWEITKIRQKYILILLLCIMIVFSTCLNNRNTISIFTDYIAQLDFYFIYTYVPILCFLVYIKSKWIQKRDQSN
ncbi:GerAB/ArcD/ProY family transporter [Bacillus wiedmannii]|uniref:GerAB/ArcD/ProY family transporter n=1 Tax=Bacillus wiedmannii TaxID=1890302 RepID=UPI000BEDDFF4|nr:GerAB/ArcD/ProY family transporter [Bacillus wiedmannii]PEF32763.1 spore gernimation protein GerH [Bacillus wiedmannii]